MAPMMTETKGQTMTTKSKINKLQKSIELQKRIKANLESMSIAAPESIECCERIIAQLKAQKAIYEVVA